MHALALDRRLVLAVFCVITGLLLMAPVGAEEGAERTPVRFGICADVHKDVMHDADARLKTFINRMNKENVDFIIQLGDFCRPYDYNRGFLGIWNEFKGSRYQVLGNHDTDGGFTREQTLKFWGYPPSTTRLTCVDTILSY